MSLNNITKTIVDAVKNINNQGTSAYDTTAEVRRIEGNTAWVHIAGGVDETPVNLTIAAKAGDTVQVRVGGGRAWITGNETAPPTDDGMAMIANSTAVGAGKTADKALQDASDAMALAESTDQHFWFTSSGNDAGAHISEVDQETFLSDPSNGGANLFARSNGIAVRDGLDELATFGANGATIGKTDESHLELDYHSFQLVDLNGDTYFYVSDLRGSDGQATLVENRTGDGSTKRFSVGLTPSSVESVTVNDISQTAGTDYSRNGIIFTFTTAPASGAVITITYKTTSHLAKAFTIGKRNADNYVAPYSLAEGYLTTASGIYSHAEGAATIASGDHAHAEGLSSTASGERSHAEGDNALSSGDFSHAEGFGTTASGLASHAQNFGTIAGYEHQTAIGKYNDNKSGNLLEIGNGLGNNNRSNAFEVNANGNTTANGNIFAKRNGAARVSVTNSSTGRTVYLSSSSDGDIGLFDNENDAWVINRNSSGDVRIRSGALVIPSSGAATLSRPLKVEGHSSEIGTIVSGNETKNLATTTSFAGTGVTFDLGEGSWIITASVRFPSNATGNRRACIMTTSGTIYSSRNGGPAVSGQSMDVQTILLTQPSSTTVTYEVGYLQNSGSTLNSCTVYWRAMRVA